MMFCLPTALSDVVHADLGSERDSSFCFDRFHVELSLDVTVADLADESGPESSERHRPKPGSRAVSPDLECITLAFHYV
jgi:hypothetical protein